MTVRILLLVVAGIAFAPGCDGPARGGRFTGTLTGHVGASLSGSATFTFDRVVLGSRGDGGISVLVRFPDARYPLTPGRYVVGGAGPELDSLFATRVRVQRLDATSGNGYFTSRSGEIVLHSVGPNELRGSLRFVASWDRDTTRTVEFTGSFEAERFDYEP